VISGAGFEARLAMCCGAALLVGAAGCASRSVADATASGPSSAPSIAQLGGSGSAVASTRPDAAVSSGASAPNTITAQTTDLHPEGTDRVTFGPPLPGAKPAISYATAVAAASAYAGYSDQFAAGQEIVTFGDFTDLDARRDYGNGSYGPPFYDHLLAVDVRFVNIPLPILGGGPVASEPESPQTPVVGKGNVDIIINASSGEPITEIDQGVS
jgi:hypothetical protein